MTRKGLLSNRYRSAENQGWNLPGKLIRNTFGGTFGGPVKKDKLFFFFNYEGQRTAENQQVTQVVPTAGFREGMVTYLSDNGANQATPATLSSSQVTQLDTPYIQNGVCPWGPGPNPNVLSHFNPLPLNNGFTEGDGYTQAPTASLRRRRARSILLF
jgi:hypothetical protein